jgi:hypothetical protein
MVSPRMFCKLFFKLHNTIPAHPLGKMMMMYMHILFHCYYKNRLIGIAAKFIFK